MRTVVLVYPYLPPAFDVSGKRVYRLAKYLPEHGWRAVIVAGPEPPIERSDPSLPALPPPTIVHRDLWPGWWRPGTRRLSDPTVAAPTRRRRARPQWGGIPMGSNVRYVPGMTRRIANHVRAANAEAIVASGGPYVLLAAGLLAGRRTGRPTLIDIRDPWTANFLAGGRASWVHRVESRIERWMVETAAASLFTSGASCRLHQERYPKAAARMHTLYYGFDPADRPPPVPGARRSIVHFGNCYGPRRLDTLLRALAEHQGAEWHLINLGRVQEVDLDLAAELGVADRFEVRTALPYRDGLALLAAADLLYLPGFGTDQPIVPGKLSDYVLAGRPILAEAPTAEVASLLARGRQSVVIAAHDVDGAAAVLARVGTDCREVANPTDLETLLSTPRLAGELAARLERATQPS